MLRTLSSTTTTGRRAIVTPHRSQLLFLPFLAHNCSGERCVALRDARGTWLMWPGQMVIVGLAVLAGSVLFPAVRAQSAGETIRVSVVATDSNGQSVRGLQPSDISLKDDGRAVKVTSFQAVTSTQSSAQG